MSAQPDREFRLPERPRSPWWPWMVAALAHIPIVVVLIAVPKPHVPTLLELHAIALSDSIRAVPMPYAHGGRRIAVATPLAPLTHLLLPSPPPAAPPPTAPQRMAQGVPPPAALAQAVPAAPVDTPPTGGSLIRPRYGDGRLWVQPLVESPRQIAGALTGKTQAELNDSAVTAMVQAYLDQMAKERAENPSALPSWTTKIGGKTVGIDQKWIYLGPLKVPTALLALLPINVQANPTVADFNRRLQQMRSDLMEAARRAENYDEFKKAVKALHDQTERKREFQKNQRTRPDTSKHG